MLLMTSIWHTQWVHGFVTRLQILSFASRDIYPAAERAVMFDKE